MSDVETTDYASDVSDAETIQYAEPYKNTFTKKDKLFRLKRKRKAIETLKSKKTPKLRVVRVESPNIKITQTNQFHIQPLGEKLRKKPCPWQFSCCKS